MTTHLGTVIADASGKRLTLVGVIDAEVEDPAQRAARRAVVREACWDAVDAGTYPDFDHAIAAYASGDLVVAEVAA